MIVEYHFDCNYLFGFGVFGQLYLAVRTKTGNGNTAVLAFDELVFLIVVHLDFNN